jgi:aldehyde dehydrogenase (NAD+)
VRSRKSLFIGGKWVDSEGSSEIRVINPVSEETVGTAPDGTVNDMDRAVEAARRSFDDGPWRWTSPGERSVILERAAELLEDRRAEIRDLIIDENGSPFGFVDAIQLQTTIDLFRYYAGLARSYPFEDRRRDQSGTSLVLREPVGVVATIVPWNTPLRSTVLKAAPALAAGCSVVHKPDPATPLDAFCLAEILADAGLPDGVFNVVPADRQVGEHLISHSGIDKIAFTGSTAAGRRIMSICGERIARVSLELGGKSAAIVLEDAPLSSTIRSLIALAFMNSGQACVAQSRILVPKTLYREFVEAFCDAASTVIVGDPHVPSTFIGPMITSSHRDRVEGYIAIGRAEGARVALGGGRPTDEPRGWFVQPTVFADVDNSMRIAREEIFGPVVSILSYDDPAEAIDIANDSDYGLSGTVWTRDTEAGITVARKVRTGTYSLNGAPQAGFTPYGGFKQSGVGREACSDTLDLYTEAKSIAVPA